MLFICTAYANFSMTTGSRKKGRRLIPCKRDTTAKRRTVFRQKLLLSMEAGEIKNEELFTAKPEKRTDLNRQTNQNRLTCNFHQQTLDSSFDYVHTRGNANEKDN